MALGPDTAHGPVYASNAVFTATCSSNALGKMQTALLHTPPRLVSSPGTLTERQHAASEPATGLVLQCGGPPARARERIAPPCALKEARLGRGPELRRARPTSEGKRPNLHDTRGCAKQLRKARVGKAVQNWYGPNAGHRASPTTCLSAPFGYERCHDCWRALRSASVVSTAASAAGAVCARPEARVSPRRAR